MPTCKGGADNDQRKEWPAGTAMSEKQHGHSLGSRSLFKFVKHRNRFDSHKKRRSAHTFRKFLRFMSDPYIRNKLPV
jgi:hypothetical protein